MNPLDALQDRFSVAWPAINEARERSSLTVQRLGQLVGPLASEDTSLVVFGSLAREEYTEGSDVDWTLLLDGQADPEHWTVTREIARELERGGFVKPGQEGAFGRYTSSHDLLHRIGGNDDTNANTTQRILLLLESVPIGPRREAHDRVIRYLLRRYVTEDFRPHESDTRKVPRFLLNDIVRYWRTMTVDFAAKRRNRGGDGWALRHAKLRLSRKLIFAAGMVACFRAAHEEPVYRGLFPDPAPTVVEDALHRAFRQTPLEILAEAYMQFSDTAATDGLELFHAYDRFLAMLDGPERNVLRNLRLDETEDPVLQEVLHLGERFQRGLDALFFPAQGGALHDFTRRYGVF